VSFDHEHVTIVTGGRSGLPIIVAVHSTALGQAVGGCRLWQYESWRDGLEDALRLSEAMTLKTALAELPVGGGKSVIALGPDDELPASRRRDALLDLGDLIASLGGTYGVGEDVGTTAEDMLVVRERTEHAYCLPQREGGAGDPSDATARGVAASLNVVAQRLFGAPTLQGRRVVIVGLGQVGSRVARQLVADGAQLIVTDVDESKQPFAEELGAAWTAPKSAYETHCDVLVPAALGGVLTTERVPTLRCRAICGPANNQLVERDVADALAAAGIVWAPDFVVNAGGVIHGVLIDMLGMTSTGVATRVDAIADTLTMVLTTAERERVPPLVAAERIACDRVAKGGASG
jgi:leucine dehydrogenase